MELDNLGFNCLAKFLSRSSIYYFILKYREIFDLMDIPFFLNGLVSAP